MTLHLKLRYKIHICSFQNDGYRASYMERVMKWRGKGLESHFPAHIFSNPIFQCSNPISTSRIQKKSQSYTYQLFSLGICKTTTSKQRFLDDDFEILISIFKNLTNETLNFLHKSYLTNRYIFYRY